MALIQEGNTVVLDENGEKKSFVKLKKKGSARIGKSQLSTDPFLGSPFGAVFSLSADGKSMQRVTECPTGEWATQHNISTMRNNAELFDRNTANQKLTDADIAAMRASGKEGAEIVEALISNSATFESKTEFSQEKYRKKKTKKYVINVTLRRPTALTICQAYFEKGPARVFNLRPDSLAIMLSLANLSAGAKVLVMDACVGVVAAAVVERLGGFGHVCCVHADKPMSTDCVRLLNLSPQQASVQCSASLAALHEAKALGPDWQPGAAVAAPAAQQAASTGATKHAAEVPPQANGAQPEGQQQQQQQQQQHGVDSVTRAGGAGGPDPMDIQTSSTQAAPAPAAAEPAGAGEAVVSAPAIEKQQQQHSQEQQQQQHSQEQQQHLQEHQHQPKERTLQTQPQQHSQEQQQQQQEQTQQAQPQQQLRQQQEQQQQQQQEQTRQAQPQQLLQQQQQQSQQQQQQQQQHQGQEVVKCVGPREREEKAARHLSLLHQLVHPGFNSCIIAVPRLHPISVMEEVLPLLQPSTPFVLYSQWVQPLAECLHHLLSTHQAVLLQLQESWMRPYQVLPSRTHPLMTTSGTGGFILSGTKVLPGEAAGGSQNQQQQQQATQQRNGGKSGKQGGGNPRKREGGGKQQQGNAAKRRR